MPDPDTELDLLRRINAELTIEREELLEHLAAGARIIESLYAHARSTGYFADDE